MGWTSTLRRWRLKLALWPAVDATDPRIMNALQHQQSLVDEPILYDAAIREVNRAVGDEIARWRRDQFTTVSIPDKRFDEIVRELERRAKQARARIRDDFKVRGLPVREEGDDGEVR